MRQGFSLVELSIVLVILGLLTGGILSGQSLIHAAELRKTTSDITRIKTSLYTFRDKYFALPGDMTNASAFWGAADGSTGLTAGCATATATGTCNGNGDGAIAMGTETYRMWQQLNLAGLMEGSFTGVPGPSPNATQSDVIGTNIPKSALSGTYGYSIGSVRSYFAYSSTSMPAQNALVISPCCNTTEKIVDGASMKPEDLWNVDTKLDDGKPGSGIVQIHGGYASGCATDASTYVLGSSGINCMPVIGMGL